MGAHLSDIALVCATWATLAGRIVRATHFACVSAGAIPGALEFAIMRGMVIPFYARGPA